MNALGLMASLVLEDGRRWGDVAADFQWEDARAVLDEDATPYHYLTRARGGSKTADLGGLAIAAMLAQLPHGSRLYGVAADLEQGRLLLDSIDGYAKRTPELRDALSLQSYRVVARRGGSVLDVLAADAAGAWGLRPAFVVVDELSQWNATAGPRRIFEAVTSAVAKVAGARLAILTTAGDPAHWSRKVLDHALRDPLWRVHEVAGPPPWLDPARLAEQHRRLLPSAYARLFENKWVAAEDRLVDAQALRECVTLDGPQPPVPGLRYTIGVDLGTVRDATAAAVVHGEPIAGAEDGAPRTKVVLDRLQVWQGTRERPVQLAAVEAWLTEAAWAYRAKKVVLDPWQAVGLAQRLRSRGIRVEEFSFSSASVGRLAATLHQLLRNRALALPDDEALLDELANVHLRETSPGVLRIDHDPDRHDDRVTALALAAQDVVATARPGPTLAPRPLTSYDVGGPSEILAAFPSMIDAGPEGEVDLSIRYDEKL